MNELENVTRIEYEHLRVDMPHIVFEALVNVISKGIIGFARSARQYSLRYEPQTKKVVIVKPRDEGKSTLKYVRNLVQVEVPNPFEEEILKVAQQYLEQYRVALD